jgi:Beta-ketoacyl synthase, C-terminal domain
MLAGQRPPRVARSFRILSQTFLLRSYISDGIPCVCCAVADLQPSELGMVAVHGTGTPLGDPIEVGALGQALGSATAAHRVGGNGIGAGAGHRVALASVKSCYGHTEGAAGLTGALLAVSSLQAQVSSPAPSMLRPDLPACLPACCVGFSCCHCVVCAGWAPVR